MSKDELLVELAELQTNGDTEVAHAEADRALLDYIDDEDIRIAYENIDKWYA